MKNNVQTKENCDRVNSKQECTESMEKENSTSVEDNSELTELKQKLANKEKETEEYISLLQRTLAEFDNYKKRTAKEKEALYGNAVTDIMTNILPVIDNLEKAVESSKDDKSTGIVEGVTMVLRQMKDALNSLGVYEIETEGQKFNPDLHEAVMHIQDENLSEGQIVEVFRKGYIFGDKVIRYSMVKVAN